MKIFECVGNIFTKKHFNWINELNQNEFHPIVLNKWIGMIDIAGAKYLNRYTYTLNMKQFIMLAITITKRYDRPPFIQYIKKDDIEDIYDNILNIIKNKLQISNNDMKYYGKYFIKEFNSNKLKWLAKLGCDEIMYKTFGLDIKQNYGNKVEFKHGLDQWF